MQIETGAILSVMTIGFGASLMMDLWGWLLKQSLKINSLNYCLLGRWVCAMRQGQWQHQSIVHSPRQNHECLVGWWVHFFTGMFFALPLLILSQGRWLQDPDLLSALVLGWSTIIFPWFVMQPALGMGMMACRTPTPISARLKSVLTHSVFGLGLYVCAELLLWIKEGL